MATKPFTPKDLIHRIFDRKMVSLVLSVMLLVVYISYVAFIIISNRGPVDYETFMQIGKRFLLGQPVYGENSYYPMPYVIIFAFYAWLPRPLSMVLWFTLPMAAAMLIQRGKPWVLLFAPLISHFLGGQTALPALLGLWGFRSKISPDQFWGGVWLAFIALKPQLAVFPLIWAGVHWLQHLIKFKKVPSQFWGFLITISLIYLPSFLLQPDWMKYWLAAPRPLFERALAGLMPRILLNFIPYSTIKYWILLLFVSVSTACYIGWRSKWKIDFDLYMTSSFLINPLAHDYDLIQLIPLLRRREYHEMALLVSIPAILVIIFAYQIDRAWFVFTLIPLVLVMAMLKVKQEQQPALPSRHSCADAASARQ